MVPYRSTIGMHVVTRTMQKGEVVKMTAPICPPWGGACDGKLCPSKPIASLAS
jgi:hypothetical protein